MAATKPSSTRRCQNPRATQPSKPGTACHQMFQTTRGDKVPTTMGALEDPMALFVVWVVFDPGMAKFLHRIVVVAIYGFFVAIF
eukprot:CAMPEP_0172463418 /NCGR_PEP_ID=MMETSP1065-20121228/47123_1 /TAXON_ID=265537 /ORGANISM="Amphiprora paludosa, Strain CCMP125" /LENGTH=83 /DNA_ID=CAMNT_0013219359 /DNA_START=304 /DNA_END=555 /DNA_ORIENTATION=+